MCGLVGLIQKDNKNYNLKRKTFELMLFLDTVRGDDGTGIFYANNFTDSPEVFKKAYPAPEFMQLDRFKKAMYHIEKHQYTIGHNRAATAGGISHDTSHPFVEEHITLVHNGTLKDEVGLPNRKVDSNAIAAGLAKAEKIQDILEDLNGAYALIWHDSKDECLYIAKNDERPLHYADTDIGRVILSEKAMLEYVVAKLGLKVEGQIKAFENHKIYKTWISKKGNLSYQAKGYTPSFRTQYSSYYGGYNTGTYGNQGKKLPTKVNQNTGLNKNMNFRFFVRGFVPYNSDKSSRGKLRLEFESGAYPDAEIIAHSCSHTDWEEWKGKVVLGKVEADYTNNLGRHLSVNVSGLAPAKNSDSTSNVVQLEDPANDDSGEQYKMPDGKYVSENKFNDLVSNGCCMCGSHVFWHDKDNIDWARVGNNFEPICSGCVSNWEEWYPNVYSS